MPAYVVAMMTVDNPETYRKYTDRTPEIIRRHGGSFVTRGEAIRCLEGEAYEGRMVILKFPSKSHVDAWFNDPDYKEAVSFRHAASTMHYLMVQETTDQAGTPAANL